jgi:Rieske Fe-S protein
MIDGGNNQEKTVGRRSLIVYACAAVLGLCGFMTAIAKQVLGFISGPNLTSAEKSHMVNQEMNLLEEQKQYDQMKLARMNTSKLPVAKVSDLDKNGGKIFTDYFLLPAVVFKNGENSCIARSAVCTHLGCTVQPELVDGKIYCACHMSYFDLQTGKPLAGPATIALPEEPIVIEDDIIYAVRPSGPIKIGPSQTPMNPV